MRENHTLADDLTALAGNILGNLLGARHEMKAQAKQRLDSLARQFDLVSRGEFDAAFAMLAKARAMQEELAERLEILEAKTERFLDEKNELRKRSVPAKAGIDRQRSSASGIRSHAKRRLPSLRKSNRRRKPGNRG